jgi:hypothetical protein
MGNKIVVFMLSYMLSTPLFAVDNIRTTSIKGLALGINGVTQSLYYNPSIISLSTSPTLQAMFVNKFAIKELSTYSFQAVYPHTFASIAVSAATFGSSFYRNSSVGVTLSKSCFKHWMVGGSFYYQRIVIPTMQMNQQMVDIGITYTPNASLIVALSALNVINDCSIRVGAEWGIVSQVALLTELVYDSNQFSSVSFGIGYEIYQSLYLRAGLIAPTIQPSFGLGYSIGKFTLDVACTYHAQLGISSGAGLKVSF